MTPADYEPPGFSAWQDTERVVSSPVVKLKVSIAYNYIYLLLLYFI